MTSVDICNLALDLIGAEGILTSLADKTKEGRLCTRNYDPSRRSVLTLHPWKFASNRVILTASVTIPAFKYTTQYDLPADCLKPRLLNDSDEDWVREGAELFTFTTGMANLTYTKDITDPTLFDAQFCDVLAYHLAKKMAYALTQSNEREQFLAAEYLRVQKAARFSDSVQQSPPAIIADVYDNVRIGPNRGFVRDPQT